MLAALVALLAGLAIGKAWERYKLQDGTWIDRRRARESPHYILGLNFLVANQIDLAIEELSRAASLDQDALEVHMILGNLYREKGQVGKAITVHQGLLQRPKLSRLEHAYVLLCLGLDYKRGGFVERALEAFNEVLRLDQKNEYALLNLQKLHEEQHQWIEAYDTRQRLSQLSDDGGARPQNQAILAFLENEIGLEAVRRKYELLLPLMNERMRRHWAACEAQTLGRGGVTLVAHATGLSRTTITAGLRELRQRVDHPEEQLAPERVRAFGAGRTLLEVNDPALTDALEALVGPTTRGDPQSPLRWTCKSTRNLADELRRQGHTVSHQTVATLLDYLGYSLQANRKVREGAEHPDRDFPRLTGHQNRAQFVHSSAVSIGSALATAGSQMASASGCMRQLRASIF
jgi:tetratricopeptide (TPR) repeat protein